MLFYVIAVFLGIFPAVLLLFSFVDLLLFARRSLRRRRRRRREHALRLLKLLRHSSTCSETLGLAAAAANML